MKFIGFYTPQYLMSQDGHFMLQVALQTNKKATIQSSIIAFLF